MPRARKQSPIDLGRAVAYLGPPADTAAEQERIVREIAAARGLEIAAVHRDVVAERLDQRDGFVAALVDAERLGLGVFLTASLDVLATNAAEHALALRAIERSGSQWRWAAGEPSWPSAAVEQAYEALRAHESMIFRPKVILGQRGGPEARPGGPPPWGYRRDASTGQFVEDPDEQRVIIELVSMRREGKGLGALAEWLQEQKLPGRAARIYKSTISSILKQAERRGIR